MKNFLIITGVLVFFLICTSLSEWDKPDSWIINNVSRPIVDIFTTTKVGNAKISSSIKESIIRIDNFPHHRIGVVGINAVSWPSKFAPEKLDEAIFKEIKNNSFSETVGIWIRFSEEDSYGKESKSEWYSLGSISSSETKKYESFDLWSYKYSVIKMYFQKF